jgi:selenocysteine lyase/cysteine desulfurase
LASEKVTHFIKQRMKHSIESMFEKYRQNTIGYDYEFHGPNGMLKLVYADWIASGRLYAPIEKRMTDFIGPFVANTHTESNATGTLMTDAYHFSREIIKRHVNASPDDMLITTGFGMTAAIVKLQRILGFKLCGKLAGSDCLEKTQKPVVFITHMEHHSNQTSWYETIADVVIVEPNKNMEVNLNDLEEKLKKYADRKLKIGSFTACSNVTGVRTPIHQMAAIMHKYGGYCFVDYAASAPYDNINMHPEKEDERLDAIFFSPHKFLGGPGASGVLIFHKSLYNSKSPDQPGGGTVEWTNPWGEYRYISDIEVREDGGTPGFLQSMKAAFAILLKEQMNPDLIKEREIQLLKIAFGEMRKIPRLRILADHIEDRLGVISFYIEDLHYNLIVKLLSDRFGIQVRGGCACAGTYGHYLLEVSYEKSQGITSLISMGDLSQKPGWVRLSLHPIMKDEEVFFITNAIAQVAQNYHKWATDYDYDKKTNEFAHKEFKDCSRPIVENWFTLV